jgi:hypothetical protein
MREESDGRGCWGSQRPENFSLHPAFSPNLDELAGFEI